MGFSKPIKYEKCCFWTSVVSTLKSFFNNKFRFSLVLQTSPFLVCTPSDLLLIMSITTVLLLSILFFALKRFNHSNRHNLFTYPLLLVFISLIILAITDSSLDLFFKTLVLLAIFIIFIFFLYQLLYYWRNLSLSIPSFIRFLINMIQFSLYIVTFYLLLQASTLVYLSNLSQISQYRYLVFSIISLSFITIIVFSLLFRINFDYFSSKITFPFFKEEVRLILYTWNNTIWGEYCSKLIDLLAEGWKVRSFYFLVNFIIFYLLRIVALFIFVNFTFFHGDLRSLFYLSPFLFIAWICSFFDYYFITFLDQHSNYLRLLVSVNPKTTPMVHSVGIVQTSADNLSFTLTSEAILRGFTTEDLPMLSSEWLKAARITTFFIWYRHIVKFFNLALLFIHIICWYFITYIFFIAKTSTGIVFSGLLSAFFQTAKQGSQKFFSRSYAIEAYKVHPSSKKPLEQATAGGYKAPHLAMADKEVRNPSNPQEVKYHGQPTHGKGTDQHKADPLHPTHDIEGKPRAQNFVPPKKGNEYIPEHWTLVRGV